MPIGQATLTEEDRMRRVYDILWGILIACIIVWVVEIWYAVHMGMFIFPSWLLFPSLGLGLIAAAGVQVIGSILARREGIHP